ncbi:dihydrolipoyl dehydrogenase [Variovorax ginsengisoli]|uniref:Dihydrolipoyl dehydrogenase n=1 Tax=Variovorax ginsengisoli TaxID=363844 RepID=A0ABT8SI11_9BURK|nr:dihydrolipoyl dehydrogenase [Variovorax ginsengisoli]MDN8618482.1 dihydrolipoyl dehydrogenase [Variovorax ginsengisoli]MDO1537652.1 dihydrolipoyl dehydrogenase [Variovorax ginsengisoli]
MSTPSDNFDVLVLGGGPGGYVAALRASQLGLKTALVEREHLGGICLNWGCIPTKALLHGADLLRTLRHAADYGIQVSEPRTDLAAMIARSRGVANRLSGGIGGLLKKAKAQVFAGEAQFASGEQVRVTMADGSIQSLQARHTIIATGARARALPDLPFDSNKVWSYRDALSAQRLPSSLLVVGAGAIGLEFASFYAALGTRITVLEAQPRVLPGSDADVSAFVEKTMTRDGVAFLTGSTLVRTEETPTGLRATVCGPRGEETMETERMLVAIGLVGNTETLGLEKTRAKVERGLIKVNDWGETTHPGIHAIGDVVGLPMLAHKAMHQGMVVAERIAGQHLNGPAPHPAIPACTYGHPQTAGIGMSEEEAKAQGRTLRVGRFPLEGNGKAVAVGEAAGFVKTLFDSGTGELLGAHIAGPEATEMIQGFAVAMGLESTEAELMATVFPHPTISEAMHESVLAAYGRALHI